MARLPLAAGFLRVSPCRIARVICKLRVCLLLFFLPDLHCLWELPDKYFKRTSWAYSETPREARRVGGGVPEERVRSCTEMKS